MSESPERPRLSGLARSIDSLFTSAPSDVSTARESAAPTPGSRESFGDAATPPAGALTGSPREEPLHAPDDVFPASQVLDAITPSPPPWAPLEPSSPEPPVAAYGTEPMPESLLTFDSRVDTQLDAQPDHAEESIADVEVAPFTDEAEADAQSLGPAAPTAHAPAEDLQQAVDAYIAGDQGARARIETSAAALRDRLALDPLADAVEALVRAAGDPPRREYIEVATVLMNPAVASRLVQRMGRERDDAKRVEFFALCGRLGRVMANGLKGALTGALDPAARRVYLDAMISMGEESRPVIEAMLEDENRFLVRDAVVMLGELGGPRAVELVTSALANSDPRVRIEALHALAHLGDADAGRLALGFLEDSDSNVRLAAAVAAAELGLERALRPLVQLLDQEEAPAKRALVLQALGELGDPGAVPVIEKHASPSRFSKATTDVRVAAYRALHRIGTPHARELVRRAASDKDPGVRAALRGLVQES